MWPWQRTRRVDRAAAGGTTADPAVGVLAPRRVEWATLPPIQRSIGELRPVSPQQDFGDSLVSWRNPSLLAPLGHLVSADGPSGVIHRLIEPAVPPAPGTDPGRVTSALPVLAPRPASHRGVVQRMLAAITPWVSRPSVPEVASAPTKEPDSAVFPVSPELPGSATPPDQETDHGPAKSGDQDSFPDRSVPADVPTGTASMIHAPAPARPIPELPVVQSAGEQLPGEPTGAWSMGEPRSDIDRGSVSTGESSPHQPAEPTLGTTVPLSASGRADSGASGSADVTQERRAIAPPVETSGRPAPTVPVVARTVAGSPLPPPAPGRTVPGAPHRLGLGPPLTPEAVTAQLSGLTSRANAAPAAPSPIPVPPILSLPVAGPPVAGPPVAGLPIPEPPVAGPPIPEPAVTEPAVTELPQRSGQAGEQAAQVDDHQTPAVQAVWEENRTPAGTSSAQLPVVARLVGERTLPLLTRSAAGPGAPASPAPPGLPDSAARFQPGSSNPTPQVQRTVAGSLVVGEGTGVSRQHAAPAELRSRPVQRMSGAGPAVPGIPAGSTAPGALPAAWRSPAAAGHPLVVQTAPPAPSRPAELPLPVQVAASDAEPPAVDPAQPGGSGPTPPPGAPPGGEPVPEEAVPGEPAPTGTAPAGTEPGAAAAGAAGASNPDELVKKLFEPLLRRLKTELRLDRERHGMLTDLRH